MPLYPNLKGTYVRQAKVADLVAPVYIAHRGAGSLFPENTLEAFAGSIDLGCKAIEAGDGYKLVDGGVGLMHDATIDRTTSGSANCADLTSGAWQQLAVDAGSWFGGGWPNTLKAPLFSQVVAQFGGQVSIITDAKTAGTAAAMAAQINARGLAPSFVISSTILSECQVAVAAGIAAMYMDPDGTNQTPAQLVTAGIGWVAVNTATVLSATVTDLKAAGIKVVGYTPARQKDIAAAVALGITDGYFTSDPIYAAGDVTKYRRTSDPFKAQSYYHGHLPSDANDRGVFTATADWGINVTTGGYRGVLQGWACPLANAAGTYTITLSLIIDTVLSADMTRWAAVFMAAPDDRAYSNVGSSADGNGYHVLFRASGIIDVYRVDAGVATLIGTKTTGVTALTLGTTVATYTIAVTATTITVNRTDVAYDTGAISDSTYRGGFFTLGRNAASVRFRNVGIS